MKEPKEWKKNHPCKSLVEDWKKLSRLKQKSVLHVVEELKTKHHLPENRENIQRVNKFIPPFIEMTQPIIKDGLFTEVVSTSGLTVLYHEVIVLFCPSSKNLMTLRSILVCQ